VRTDALGCLAAGLPLEEHPWPEALADAQWPQAAVLVALTGEDEPRVLLGRRAQHLPQHPGEVAFAGGKRESIDASPWATALREAEEEVGIPQDLPRPLGELDPLITRTGFAVYPCVARIPPQFDFIVDASEFDSILMPELSLFARRDLYRLEPMGEGAGRRMVPHYQVGDDNIWGVTAAVLALLVNVAYDAGLDLQRDWKQKP